MDRHAWPDALDFALGWVHELCCSEISGSQSLGLEPLPEYPGCWNKIYTPAE